MHRIFLNFFFSIQGRRSVKIKRADFPGDSDAGLCQVFSVFRARSAEYFLSFHMPLGEQRGTKGESVTLVGSLKPPAEETEEGEGVDGDRSPRLSLFNPCSVTGHTRLRHTWLESLTSPGCCFSFLMLFPCPCCLVICKWSYLLSD